MKKITFIMSTAVPLPIENVDTDQICPARFLKATTRENFSDKLFHDWRFDSQGKKKDFVLNDKEYSGEILIAGRNFGCGSSREHATWALVDYGFKAVISSFYADIFKSNALINALLPIEVTDSFLQFLFQIIQKNPETSIRIDLKTQTIHIPELKIIKKFFINPYKKDCLMNGFSDIDYLLSKKKFVELYEKNNRSITW